MALLAHGTDTHRGATPSARRRHGQALTHLMATAPLPDALHDRSDDRLTTHGRSL